MESNQQPATEFLLKLADLCEQYDAGFTYSQDDDGTHVTLGSKVIFIGYLDDRVASQLRAAAAERV